jgi:drug/metabolite transporter (DMT)-like permease
LISALIFGLLSAFSFGTADFLAGLTSRKIGSYATLFYMQILGLLVLSIYLFSSGDWIMLVNHWHAIKLAMLFMGIDLLGILCLYQGLATGNVSVVAPISSSFAIVTVILALLFGENPSPIVLLAILLTIGGVVTASFRAGEGDKRKGQSTNGIAWGILAAILLGVAFFGIKYPTEEIGAYVTVWIGRLQATIILPILLVILKKKLKKPRRSDIGWLFLVGLLDMIAFISYNIGIMKADTSIVVIITSLFSIVSIFWGVVIWKEKMTWNQAIGVCLVLIGILVININ